MSSQPAIERPTLRASLDGDLPAIQAIYAHHVLHGSGSFELEPPDLDEMTARRRAILERGLPYLVADWQGAVAGYAYAGPYRPRPAYRFTLEVSVYVAPDRQRLGLGRLLLGGLIERAEALGYRQLIAVVGDSANLASIGLHESLGFQRAGVLRSVGWKHGRWLDSVFLQRSLGAGDDAPPER
ncbi:phosphinothricin acetyltransferase [Tistlia consotensis]|uniref:Phosphinothricin acetyltransferase n=1 Tax=Tistlia consotensis USBA 355 TaxID=560819 RepID=A0A1Y6C8G7_9PROT|nr:GNAT family N-acetyltransferase [Tistlia consotensis]SMF51506.1 phosphinothricin acetyltransferase [Tistlia consotensis USBA 355]SNR84144.1 phosphinothricin acetyltransferase [Tistlia consotensis]